jgi:carbon-monoxide dehydrogenase small subunit
MTADVVLVSLRINGEMRHAAVPAGRTLLDVLRDDMRLTGAKRACEAGACGACNVLVDGCTARSCLSLAADLGDCEITTIEGLAEGDVPSLVQQAFLDAGAIQCGFCMPGMILSATELLAANPAPSLEEIRVGISGNLCRCSGYVKVIEAVALAARRLTPRQAVLAPR